MAIESADQIVHDLKVEGELDLTAVSTTGPKVMLRIQNKTASYTVLNSDSGTIFTNVGDADAIVYTLPALPLKGLFFLFIQCVDQNLSVASASANQIRTFNDLDADACTFVTGGNLIGACLLVIGQGSYWLAAQLGAHTMTVTT